MRRQLLRWLPWYSRFTAGETLECVQLEVASLKIRGLFPIIDNALEHDDSQVERIRSETEASIRILPGECIAVKLTSLGMDDMQPIYRICDLAEEHGNTLLIDAEQIGVQDKIEDITDMLMLKYNKNRPIVHKTYQMYRIDRLKILEDDIMRTETRDIYHGFKIVRGAYLNEEVKLGNQKYLCPDIYATHKNYDNAVDAVSESTHSHGIVATHNNHSCERLVKNDRIAVAQLKGMADQLSADMHLAGFKVFKYIPWGPFTECVPYLTRRLYENYEMLKHL